MPFERKRKREKSFKVAKFTTKRNPAPRYEKKREKNHSFRLGEGRGKDLKQSIKLSNN